MVGETDRQIEPRAGNVRRASPKGTRRGDEFRFMDGRRTAGRMVRKKPGFLEKPGFFRGLFRDRQIGACPTRSDYSARWRARRR